MLTGMVPTFLKIYTLLLLVVFLIIKGIYISDYAFSYNYLEGELWEGHSAFSGPELVYIPHDPYNNLSSNLKSYSDDAIQPKIKIPLDKKNANSYVQIN